VRLETLHDAPEDELEEDDFPSHSRPSHRLSPDEMGILLREYLDMLPLEDQRLIERYHLEDRKALAVELNKTENALRVEVCRIKRVLLERAKEGETSSNDAPTRPA
jgi:hypothetical protein